VLLAVLDNFLLLKILLFLHNFLLLKILILLLKILERMQKKEGKGTKVDANVDEPTIDILTAVGKLFGNLQKYQHKESFVVGHQ
jgi:hypothetical protein